MELASRRPRRADARRNFDALLAGAREVFAEDGAHTSLEEVARRAGVSIATLYRNFPTREDLVEEVHRDEVEALCRAADEVAELQPWDALEAWLHRFVAYIGAKLAFADSLNRNGNSFQACRLAMRAAGQPLLERAQEAGVARPEISIDDALRMISGVSTVEYVDGAQRARVLHVALAGLRSDPEVRRTGPGRSAALDRRRF